MAQSEFDLENETKINVIGNHTLQLVFKVLQDQVQDIKQYETVLFKCKTSKTSCHNTKVLRTEESVIPRKMSLVVAMALSGLDPDQWSDELRDMYEKGAQLVNKPCQFTRLSTSSPGASSIASSYQSLESGISSLSPSSGEFINPFHQNTFDATYPLTKVPGKKTLEEVEREFTEKRTTKRQEIKSTSDKDELGNVPKSTSDKDELGNVPKSTSDKDEPGNVPLTVVYCKRNLLDLGDHLKNSCRFIYPAVIPKGVISYFENRSQISRLSGAEPPSFCIYSCSFANCGFNEPHYY